MQNVCLILILFVNIFFLIYYVFRAINVYKILIQIQTNQNKIRLPFQA